MITKRATHYGVMAAGVLGLLVVLLCGESVSILAFVAVVFATAIASALNRCLVCGKPVGWNPVRMLRGKLGWTISIPDRCSKCRHPFPASLPDGTPAKPNRAPRA